MREIPEDVTKAAVMAWQKHRGQAPIADTMLHILEDAIHAERLSERIRMGMHMQNMCAAAYDRGWMDCLSEPRPMAAARESMKRRYLAEEA